METNEQNELPIVNNDIEQEFSDALDEMPDITVTCQSAGCTAGAAGAAWSWTGDSAIAGTHLQFHYTSSHGQPTATTPHRPRPPALQPPKLAAQCSEQRFDEFQREWEFYKRSVDMPAETVTSYLLHCLEEEVRKDVRAATTDILTMSENEVLAAVKQYAVQQRAVSSMKMDLWHMVQGDGEGVRQFYARVQNTARQCNLTVPCTEVACPRRAAPFISYCDEIVKQVVLCGLADSDIKKDVLGVSGINTKTLAETLGIIEDKETAARATTDRATAGAATSYKKISAGDNRLKSTGKCDKCSKTFTNKAIRSRKGKNDEITTFTTCKDCWKKARPPPKTNNRQKPGNTEEEAATEANATETATFSFFALETQPDAGTPEQALPGAPVVKVINVPQAPARRRRTGRRCRRRRGRRPQVTLMAASSETIDAMSFDSTRGWVSRVEDHGKVKLSAYTVPEDARAFGIAHREVRPTNITAVADSGCQACLMGLQQLYKMGLQKSDLCRIRSTATSINGNNLNVIGAIVLRLSGMDPSTGKVVETAAQVRVAEGVKDLFISKNVMIALGIIKADFPSITAAATSSQGLVGAERLKQGTPGKPGLLVKKFGHTEETCPGGCKKRGPPPPLPTRLPFEPTEENADKMKAWLLDRYATSTFNKCGHQPLPMMSCEPLRIHIDPEAKPVANHNARPVPIHLREKVKAQLEEDVRLGVIERVPVGTPTTWQSRMHVVTKPNGEPRRTVDFRPLNKHCLRENESITSPFKQARQIPAGVLKTKTDAWNGYHSCPLAEEDRDLTTFITEEGRFRYKVAPQGFVASGDAYNQRFGRVLDRITDKTRCVDDVALWDKNVEEHWWRVIKYLDLVGRNGILLNPDKFQFCQHEIDFAGFRVTDQEVKPLPKYLEAIKNFPRPTNISDIRSWFGLVNQVASYNQLIEMMKPFRPFLSPKVRFKWDDELETAFEASKQAIMRAIVEGVAIFDPERRTAISTDYSTTGIGYFLYQKYCPCVSTVTTCCSTGWRVTLAGSRFLHQAEANYWPTEGEMLAVAWALHDSRYFTLGCRDLHVQTDHRALVKLLGDKNLEDIDNRRLVNLKEKTMPWNFTISWVPGTAIPAPDATSRRPQDTTSAGDDFPVALAALRMVEETADDLAGDTEFAAVGTLKAGEIAAVTWERVQEETWLDASMRNLVSAIKQGFNEAILERLPEGLADYWRYRDNLEVVDGVVMMGERIVIPPSLRPEVLDHLHGAHHGVSQMTARARASLFWPGITSDIARTRDNCRTCDTIAPSQLQTDAVPPAIPTYPFEMICSDYFDLEGSHFLLTVDRFTGWVDVRRAKPHTEESGARGLIRAVKESFMAHGVPIEMANDGGPEYRSKEFGDFLSRWGVRLRTSSAYHAPSNGRAEVAVKTTKRAMRDSIGPDGQLDSDKFARALMLIRNTPDRETGQSPAEILLGRRLRDALPVMPRMSALTDSNSPVATRWQQTWSEREMAMRHRAAHLVDKLDAKAHDLAPLEVGDKVKVQNQTGPSKTRWFRTGTIQEINLPHDMYHVLMDGSRRTTARNRKFLRKIRTMAPPDYRRREAGSTAPARAPGQTTWQERPGVGTTTAVRPPTTPTTQVTPPPRPATGPPRPAVTGPESWQGTPVSRNTPPATPVIPSTTATGVPLRRRISFGDEPRLEAEYVDHGQQEEPAQPARPERPAQPTPEPAQPTQPAQQPAQGPARPRRAVKPPTWHRDYDFDGMELRRVVTDGTNGVEGMKEYDITGNKLAVIETPICVETSAHDVTTGSGETLAASMAENMLHLLVGSIKDMLHDNRMAEPALNILGRTAYNLGQLNRHRSKQP